MVPIQLEEEELHDNLLLLLSVVFNIKQIVVNIQNTLFQLSSF
jgi:hypothetical protein